ncbi:MAG: methyltransferase domain-containing protein [Anaerolineae bacterium]|nr:methyltransferase domain-containing protein [Anaerolineae bacterium]
MNASVNFDRAVAFYDDTRGFPPGIAAPVAALMAQAGGLHKGDQVLEIGIGTGRIALPLAQHTGSITGVDISRQMMQRLRQKQTTETIYLAQADAGVLPFAAGTFDAAVVVHVLHLVAQPAQVVRDLARVLKPGGRLLHAFNDHHNDPRMQALVEAARPDSQRARLERYNAIDHHFSAAGWQRTDEQRLTYARRTTPAEYLAHIEQRRWSNTWELPDEEIAHMLARARRAVAEHFGGDMHLPVDNPGLFVVQVWAPPAA